MAKDAFGEGMLVEVDGLDDCEYSKLMFVQEYVAPLVYVATEGYVFRCEYAKSKAGFEAVLMTARADGEPEPRRFRADVTADSEWAIAKDVMRAVSRVYE